ncbi:MAG: hypothetical protein V3V20_02780 [Algisphaera sp.]
MPANELGFFQKHTEKLVLGVGLAVLLGAGATQFLLGKPNAITLGGKEVGPGEIVEQVEKQVKRLDGKLNETQGPVKAFTPPAYTENFAKLYNRPVAEGQLQGMLSGGGLEGKLAVRDTPNYPAKVLPSPPVTFNLVVKTGHGVLADASDAKDIDSVSAIREIIGGGRPADFPYVSVRGKFSMAQWRKRLESSGTTADDRIDKSVWSRRLAVTGVYLVREELDAARGQWGQSKVVRPIPGQFGVLPDDRPQLSRGEADRLESDVLGQQAEIRRPSFPTLNNGVWTPPDATNRTYTEEEKAQIKSLEAAIARIQKQLEKLSGSSSRSSRRPSTRPSSTPPSDMMGPEGPSRRPTRSPRSTSGSSRAEREAQKTQKKIETLQEQLGEKQKELDVLRGIDEPGISDAGMGGRNPGLRSQDMQGAASGMGASGLQDGKQEDEVQVWAHDITCKPGHTYRYKLVAGVFNPLYRQTRLTKKQFKENYDRVSIGPDIQALAEMPWSAPVVLTPRYEYFVTSGNYAEKRAEFEIWTIYDGVWQNEKFPEVLGNEIGGVATEDASGGVPMDIGKILLDVDTVSSTVSGGSTQIRALVLDQKTGLIETRMINDDRRSDRLGELKEERERQLRERDGGADGFG